jgi:uncharacterized NAD(P)/FAD-binding protein YdhS
MYLPIFKTFEIGIKQSCEAENNFVAIHLSRRSVLQGFTLIAHRFLKVIEGQDYLDGEIVEEDTSKYLPRTYFGKYLPNHIIELQIK